MDAEEYLDRYGVTAYMKDVVTLLLALRIDLTPELDAYTWVVPTVTAVLYPLLLLAFQLLPAPFPSRLLSHMTVAHNALLCAASLVMSVGTVIAFARHSPCSPASRPGREAR